MSRTTSWINPREADNGEAQAEKTRPPPRPLEHVVDLHNRSACPAMMAAASISRAAAEACRGSGTRTTEHHIAAMSASRGRKYRPWTP